MSLDSDALGELKSMIAISRKRELNFGLCLAKKPENIALVMHRMKNPEVLMRTAKKMDGAEASKATFGTLRTKGKVVTLNCQGVAPPGTAIKCKRFFTGYGLTLKVVVSENGEDSESAA